MNARAVAAALRMLADAIEAPDGEDLSRPAAPPPEPSRRRARPTRNVPREAEPMPASEEERVAVERARWRARGALRRDGIVVKERGQ